MRLFYFENQKGERIPLNNENGIFLYQPEGLGVEYSNNYGNSGVGFFICVKNDISQGDISFTLVYPPGEESPYARYRTLMDWLFTSEEIYFVYCPYGTTEYYRHVEVHSIEKSELDQYGSLQTSMSLMPLTPWYIPSPIKINFGEETANTMRYDFVYSDDLIYGVGLNNYTAEVTNTGHMPAAIKVTFKGEVINPLLILRGELTRKEYGSCRINETFAPSDTLEFSTEEQNAYVRKISASDEKTDLLDKIDITTNPFFRVPNSEPCELTISGESISGKPTMLLYIYYRGV